MRLRGVNHVDLSVLAYDESLPFYDRMFGWLGYASFTTGGTPYTATYYVAFPHSYVGIHPAGESFTARLGFAEGAPGIHHVALWARRRREVDRFHRDFLVPEGIEVTDPPAEYAVYAPGYYAVFFLDPTGIRWELAHIPLLPTPAQIARSWRAGKEIWRQHPEWRRHPLFAAWRKLPRGR